MTEHKECDTTDKGMAAFDPDELAPTAIAIAPSTTTGSSRNAKFVASMKKAESVTEQANKHMLDYIPFFQETVDGLVGQMPQKFVEQTGGLTRAVAWAVLISWVAIWVWALVKCFTGEWSEVKTRSYLDSTPFGVPRICIAADPECMYVTLQYRGIYEQYDGGEFDKEVPLLPAADVTPLIPSEAYCLGWDNLTVQGTFEQDIYTFINIRAYPVDNSSYVANASSSCYINDFNVYLETLYDVDKPPRYMNFYQQVGKWEYKKLEVFLNLGVLHRYNYISQQTRNVEFGTFERFQERVIPWDAAGGDPIFSLYFRSSLWKDTTVQQELTLLDTFGLIGGMFGMLIFFGVIFLTIAGIAVCLMDCGRSVTTRAQTAYTKREHRRSEATL